MKVIALRPLANFGLWLRFEDGTEGTIDLSDKVGRGVFVSWTHPGAFARVQIGEFGQPIWPGDIDLCADNLYRQVTGRLPDQFSARGEPAHA